MSQKIVSQLDQDSYFAFPVTADESPLEPGVFLLPAGAVDVDPPRVPEGKRAKYNGTGFDLEEAPAVPQPQPEPPLPDEREMVRRARAVAFRDEADPIFFKAQREEATMADWRAKVAEIRDRYPYPPE